MLTIFFGIIIAALIIFLFPVSSEEKDINRRRRILSEYNVAENWKKAHKAENDGFKNAILVALADGKVWVAATLAAKLGVSTQKVSALAKQLADNGEIVVSDVKIQGKGKVKGYALPTPSADEVEDEGEGE